MIQLRKSCEISFSWHLTSCEQAMQTPAQKNVSCHLEFICAAIKKAEKCEKALTLHNTCRSQQRAFIKMKNVTAAQPACFGNCIKMLQIDSRSIITRLWCKRFARPASSSFQEEFNWGITILNKQHITG